MAGRKKRVVVPVRPGYQLGDDLSGYPQPFQLMPGISERRPARR
ncbi:MAG TPA: hypothetical protein VFB06_30005 [Streptosporangiaceae bacterium]|nr:hypothetical protein [Streptosporangiaceae bacterium]